jgi:hypothetical protein
MDHHRTKDDLAEAAIAAWASSKATQLECVDVLFEYPHGR